MSPSTQTASLAPRGVSVNSDQVVVVPAALPRSANPPRVIIIGAGSRGQTYAHCTAAVCNGIVAAVAEPHEFKRKQLGRRFIWGSGIPAEGAEFTSWKDFISYERTRRERAAAGEDVPVGVDAAFVCVQDEMHKDVVVALAGLGGLHIMCEKPLATRLSDCVDMYRALRANKNANGESFVFSIGHVLRYSPHNIELRKLLLEDHVIGDILSVVHTEPVGWWHFTHSYVRGNWRREDTSAPSLLTKSCHDIDVLLWLLCSPTSYKPGQTTPPHLPATVSCSGSLQFFKKSRKPIAAGNATNCLSCPVEESCKYSAKRIYVGKQLHGLGTGNTGWPVSIVVPDIEDSAVPKIQEEKILTAISDDYDASTPDAEVAKRNWFGRCVFEADNDVCDEEVVNITWDEDPLPPSSAVGATSLQDPTADRLGGRGAKQATFHMVAHTKKQCERYTYIYGVDGEIYADSKTITVEDFRTGTVTTHTPRMESLGHGGGDVGLTRQFIMSVDKVKNHGWTADQAQKELIGCTLEEVIRSHAMVFCADEARTGKKVVDWAKWWEKEVEGKLDV